MISHLSISNFALIAKTEVSFKKGFTVITGETGAGKSILLQALSVVLGTRADFQTIRRGTDKCVLEVTFERYPNTVDDLLKSHGLDVHPDLIIRRELTSSGRSRSFVNDSPVGLGVLKEIASLVADIHGQQENQDLLNSSYQIDTLDAYAENAMLKSRFQETYSDYQTASKQISELRALAAQVRKDQDYFEFQYKELQEADLQNDETTELEEKLSELEHTEDIQSALAEASSILGDDRGGLDVLKGVRSTLQRLLSYGNKYESLYKRLDSAIIELEDLHTELRRSGEHLEVDPVSLDRLRNRMDDLNRLLLKHNAADVKELVDVEEEYRLKLEGISSYDGELEKLEEKQQSLLAKCKELSKQLHDSRVLKAEKFAFLVEEQVRRLGMPKAHFQIGVIELEQLNKTGSDEVQFLFNANGADPLVPIANVASGGEVSRLTLGMKSVLNVADQTPTLIFDEIDAGVSGEVAKRMGALMRILSQNAQIISVTHLPGVAAKGEQHIKIAKVEDNGETVSTLSVLDSEARVREIAGMFSGEALNEASMESARSLLMDD